MLEDDLVTSPYFLKFMNEALDFYKNEKKVWHISGWNYPIKYDGQEDVFLWRTMNCWGWATWADRWKYYAKDVEKTINESLQCVQRFRHFILSNENFQYNDYKDLLAEFKDYKSRIELLSINVEKTIKGKLSKKSTALLDEDIKESAISLYDRYLKTFITSERTIRKLNIGLKEIKTIFEEESL